MTENEPMTALDRRMVLAVVAAMPVSFLIGFVFPAFRHPFVLAAAPLIAFGLVLASEHWSRHKTLVVVGLCLLVATIPFLISPSFIGRLF